MKYWDSGKSEKEREKRAVVKAVTVERSRIYGNAFEDWVREKLFPDYLYEILDAPVETEIGGRYIESRERPDFYIRHRHTGHKFWVEAKYRSNLETTFLIIRDTQLKRYRKFQEKVKPETVFLTLGFGGKPWNPKDVFILPLSKLHSPEMEVSFLEPYKIFPPAKYYQGKLI